MCSECFTLFTRFSALLEQLTDRSGSLVRAVAMPGQIERLLMVRSELAQLRSACAQARQALQEHRQQHQPAGEMLS